MAEIRPLRAIRYDTAVAGALETLVAPPYDVIDEAQRAALLERSPNNVVAIDMPRGEPDAYALAAARWSQWRDEGVTVREQEEAIWPHAQEYTGPDGVRRTRRGFFCRVRLEPYSAGTVRPHERTHPGPKEDRLRLTRATRANISPIFSLFSDPAGAAWSALEPSTRERPFGEVTDPEGTVHRIWRACDPAAIEAVRAATANTELLIADGHHRYETMQAYAEEVGGEGEHRYILMCLVALEDPGLEIFPTHRLVRGMDDTRAHALAAALERDFQITEVPLGELEPQPGSGPLEMGYLDSAGRALRLRLRDQAIADAALPGRSPAYRQLDTGVLEALILKGALGLSDDDISHFNGLFYARDTAEAIAMVQSGEYRATFLMRPPPVAQVREVAAASENMPPKSTFFYPKLLTGLLFNSLETAGPDV